MRVLELLNNAQMFMGTYMFLFPCAGDCKLYLIDVDYNVTYVSVCLSGDM